MLEHANHYATDAVRYASAGVILLPEVYHPPSTSSQCLVTDMIY